MITQGCPTAAKRMIWRCQLTYTTDQESGQFDIHSQTAMVDEWYFPLVDMMQHHHVRVKSGNAPTCLQCKHMFAIFRRTPYWGFDNLSEAYRTSPFFTLDEDLIFPISDALPVTGFPKERMTTSSEEIDNLLIVLIKKILPFSKRRV